MSRNVELEFLSLFRLCPDVSWQRKGQNWTISKGSGQELHHDTICFITFGHLVAAALLQHLARCVFELFLVNLFELKSLLSHEGRACEVNEAVVGGLNDPQGYVIKSK